MGLILAVDIGNTNITIGSFDLSEPLLLIDEVRLGTDLRRTQDEYEILLQNFFSHRVKDKIEIIALSSVVPPLTPLFVNALQRVTKTEVLQIESTGTYPVVCNVDEPRSVGADRVVNVYAAHKCYSVPAIVVDFGTATTFDVVNEKGEYEGGLIAPGLNLSVNALVTHAAKLPRFELAWTKSVIGKNTIEHMQSGAVRGYVALVDGLIEQIIEEFPSEIPCILSTGGLGELISKHSKYITTHDAALTLKGLSLLGSKSQR